MGLGKENTGGGGIILSWLSTSMQGEWLMYQVPVDQSVSTSTPARHQLFDPLFEELLCGREGQQMIGTVSWSVLWQFHQSLTPNYRLKLELESWK